MHDAPAPLAVRFRTEGDSKDDGLAARLQTVDVVADAEVVTASATTDAVDAAIRECVEANLAELTRSRFVRSRGGVQTTLDRFLLPVTS